MKRTFRLAGMVLVAAAALGAAACGGTSEYALVGTARAAGTDGTVTVEEIEGGNSLVTMTVQHLPPPERMGKGMKTYVVWFEGEGAPATKAASLGYDKEERTGNMMATTPLKKFTLKVTAEKASAVASPSDVVVLKRKVARN